MANARREQPAAVTARYLFRITTHRGNDLLATLISARKMKNISQSILA